MTSYHPNSGEMVFAISQPDDMIYSELQPGFDPGTRQDLDHDMVRWCLFGSHADAIRFLELRPDIKGYVRSFYYYWVQPPEADRNSEHPIS